ncbi:MAG: DUF4159 domain-containing protein, partial [Phycisphaerae bacterium]|nr:DUF4159 domain-containing protein [Phycisphaerae bacterium]
LASLFICQDILTTGAPARQQEKALVGAWRYLAKNLDANYIDNGYLAFCVQRVGMASGRKFIGDMDWFAAGAAELAKPQPRGRSWRGNWGSIVRASFELIFLARGRLPLTFNKLQYGTEEQWNFHNRDVPRFTEYMRRNFELRMRWQVINITGDVREMLDTPILLVAGQQAPDFTPEQWAKLREYTLRGGTLLFVPTKRNFAFINAVKKALKNLYDEQRSLAGDYYSLQKLPGDHTIYVSKNHAKIPSGQTAAPLWGVSDGTRLLAVLCERDIAKAWQRRAVAKGRIDYDLGVNFYFYATGENRMRMRMRPVFIDRGGVVRKTIKVAWLKHDGNWCSQPYALSYLSQKLIAQNRVKIDLKAGVPIEAGKLRDYHLAWMTGSKEFKLSKEQLAGLQAFIGAGGTLFINAIGGSTDFNDSVRRMLRDLFEGQDYFSSQVGALSSLVTGKFGEEFRGPRLEKLRRTIAWRRVAQDPGSVALTIYLQNDRIVAIHAPYGIHDTLDGHTAHDAKCYMPDSARNIAGNIALYALMEKPKPKPKPKKPAETKSATAPAAK